MSRRRVAIFGGSFDPVHCGHLLVAERIRDLENLDTITFVPASRSPHKQRSHASPEDRLAMLRLALRGNPGFRCSDVEIRRGSPSYTIDTVRALGRRTDTLPILVVGGDALLDLPSWHESDALLREARIVVYARPGAEAAAKRADDLGLVYHANIVSPISSRVVRDLVRRGRSIRYLVPEPVRRYIEAHGLYAPRRRS